MLSRALNGSQTAFLLEWKKGYPRLHENQRAVLEVRRYTSELPLAPFVVELSPDAGSRLIVRVSSNLQVACSTEARTDSPLNLKMLSLASCNSLLKASSALDASRCGRHTQRASVPQTIPKKADEVDPGALDADQKRLIWICYSSAIKIVS